MSNTDRVLPAVSYGQAMPDWATNGGFGSRAVGWEIPIGRGLSTLSPLGPGHHHIDVAAAARGADEPIAPIETDGLGAVPLGNLRRVGLGPVTTPCTRR
jgi:hypothetical protein